MFAVVLAKTKKNIPGHHGFIFLCIGFLSILRPEIKKDFIRELVGFYPLKIPARHLERIQEIGNCTKMFFSIIRGPKEMYVHNFYKLSE